MEKEAYSTPAALIGGTSIVIFQFQNKVARPIV